MEWNARVSELDCEHTHTYTPTEHFKRKANMSTSNNDRKRDTEKEGDMNSGSKRIRRVTALSNELMPSTTTNNRAMRLNSNFIIETNV